MNPRDRIDPPAPALSSADATAALVALEAAGGVAALPRELRDRIGGRRATRLAERLERGEPIGTALVGLRRASVGEGALLDEATRAGCLSAALGRMRARAVSVERMRSRLRWAVLGPALVTSVPLAVRSWLELGIVREIQLNHWGDSAFPTAALLQLAALWAPLVVIACVGYLLGSPWWYDYIGKIVPGAPTHQVGVWALNTGRCLPAQLGLGDQGAPLNTDPVALRFAQDAEASDRHAHVLEREIALATAHTAGGANLFVTLATCLILAPTIGSLWFLQVKQLVERLG